MNKVKVAVVGLGYWGPNLVRNFTAHKNFDMVWGVDLIEDNLIKARSEFPSLKLTKKLSDVLSDKTIDLVAIATPPETHFPLGLQVLTSRKHLWVEKPFTDSSRKAQELLTLAKKKNLYLHTDLPFIFHGPIIKIKELLSKNKIGQPFYYDSIRTNLGLIQKGVDVVWDLAPHDLSILFYLFPALTPKKVYIQGSSHVKLNDKSQIANLVIHFDRGFTAYIHLSWLSPVKVRLITIGGKRKMIVFDDIHPTEKIKIYDKNVRIEKTRATPFKPVYRSGDIWIPSFDQSEALFTQVSFLYNKLKDKKKDYFTAQIAIKILTLLESSYAK